MQVAASKSVVVNSNGGVVTSLLVDITVVGSEVVVRISPLVVACAVVGSDVVVRISPLVVACAVVGSDVVVEMNPIVMAWAVVVIPDSATADASATELALGVEV